MFDLPGQGHRHDLGVVMLNSDDGCRLGPNRLWVHLAQRLAEAGYPCLRFDYRGCGDSEGPEGPATADLALADAIAAERHLRERVCVPATVLVGICYGAEIGLLASQCTRSVAGVVACSAGRYVTTDGYSRSISDACGYLASYKAKLLSWQSWRKLLRGQVHGRLILSGLWRRLSPANRRRDRDGTAAAAERLATDAARNVPPSLFIYGAADQLTAKYMPGYHEEARSLGVDRRFHVIADANHNYSSVDWSGEVIRQVHGFVEELRPAREATDRVNG
jgi:pimeloyl-ACP methyl ester carboxylesterase